MFAMTRGPSRKPACAATNSSAPSLTSAMMTKRVADVHAAERPAAGDALEQHRVHRLAVDRPRVPEQVATSRMPPAVIASDVAMSTIVRLAVCTRGSRMMPTPFDTASMPVYVPPPSE